MDQYFSLDEKLADSEKLAGRLFSKVYECREEDGVWSLLQLLKLQRDKNILELAKTDIKSVNSLEIAKIQGKIEVIGSLLRSIQTDLNQKRGAPSSQNRISDKEDLEEEVVGVKKKKKVLRTRRQFKSEAGILT